ncbi:formate dehydrogenase accessory sulfurtransferase FdhD [Psychromarinibacter sp. C21-152]|uniref:Sulfur carrier protein FdhD n=1 Tax=Psychromarinibacter sediminicola TaxID=3033385 RepID=A0AAE3TB58_9RHOB|nr:formate dehydrogenase accessory sulfurtransferase FdhD [Psychromarinibacter sediminicola]MDF0602694.1 formate dehydrogenase accessory sulfurtransferase FdhD [Psychromarinibacter sediminicola]
MTDPVKSLPGLAVGPAGSRRVLRALPEEVPVAMVFDGSTLAVMMATPSDIEDFAMGFALTEGVIENLDQVESFEAVEQPNGIEARFWLAADRSDALKARRRAMAGPVGCGLCGIDSLDQATRALPRVSGDIRLSREDVATATDALRAHQPLHDRTHASHAAGFLRPGEGIVAAREDVGRHNALDKLIGALARAGEDPATGAFVLTSRVSVEMVQKTALAGCPVLVAVSAPTAHALRLAEGAQITLAAFARDGAFDLYSHPHRIRTGATDVA